MRQALIRTDIPGVDPDFEHQDIINGELSVDTETVRDKIRRQRNRAYLPEECVKRVARMQVLVGKDDWKNFKLMRRFVSGAQKFLAIEGSFEQAARRCRPSHGAGTTDPSASVYPDYSEPVIELLDEKNITKTRT